MKLSLEGFPTVRALPRRLPRFRLSERPPGLFTLAVAIHFFRRKDRAERLRGLLLVSLAVASLALFCLQVTLVEPTAWGDMWKAATRRIGTGDPFTWMQWARFVGGYTVLMISPSVWLLAAAGAVLCARQRRTQTEWEHFPARAASWLIGMNAAYMVLFRNASLQFSSQGS